MNYQHYEWQHLGTEDVIEVTLDKQANVRLMDPHNFNRYHRNESYISFGGVPLKTVTTFTPPNPGHWHLVVDLEGFSEGVKVGVRVIRG